MPVACALGARSQVSDRAARALAPSLSTASGRDSIALDEAIADLIDARRRLSRPPKGRVARAIRVELDLYETLI